MRMSISIDSEDICWYEAFEQRCHKYCEHGDHAKCDTCGGRRYVLTTLGARLVEFLEERYGLKQVKGEVKDGQ